MQKMKLEALEAATRNMKLLMLPTNYYMINKHYAIFYLLNESLCFCMLAYSLYYYRNRFEKFADTFFNFDLSIACITVASVGWIYKREFHKLVNDSCCSYDYQSSIMTAKVKEIEKESVEFSRTLFRWSVGLMCFTFSCLNVLPLAEAYLRSEGVYLLFPCWLPFQVSNVPLQILVLLWQETILVNIHFSAFGGLGIFYTVYSIINAQVALLRHAMENVEQRAQEMARDRKDYRRGNLQSGQVLSHCYDLCTRMCAQHHSDILEYFNTSSTGFGILYTTVFFDGILGISFGGYFIVSDNLALKVKFVGLTIVVLTTIFILFWMGESTTHIFQTVAQTVYTMEWYNLPKNCQSTLRLMQLKSNEPLFYKMVLGQRVNVEAYMSLLKASYYYINMIIAR